MLRMFKITLLVVVTFCFLSGYAIAGNIFATPKAGTLGLGADLGYDYSPSIKFRGNVNGFAMDYEHDMDDVEYDVDATLFTVGALIDWHPFQNGFRVSAGAFYNANEIDGQATLKEDKTVEIGDKEYDANDLGKLETKLDVNPVNPYLGLGWGTSPGENRNWFFSFDVGVLYQGEPDVDLKGKDIKLQGQAKKRLQTEISQEESDIQDEVESYRFYPVIALGITYRF